MITTGRFRIACFGTIALCLMILMRLPAAHAQTLTVLHTFTNGIDGSNPMAGVTMDAAGNLYGTTYAGGLGFGAVYKLSQKNGSWLFASLYQFQGGTDGAQPTARVVFGPNGTLYGTTTTGGGIQNCYNDTTCGTVFNLRPGATFPRTALSPWVETILYSFAGSPNSGSPGSGDLLFDGNGNIFGNAGGGQFGAGSVFELSPSNGGWTESIIYPFTGGADGGGPVGNMVFTSDGVLIGATLSGGDPTCIPEGGGYCGTIFGVFHSQSGWEGGADYAFEGFGDGAFPMAGVNIDPSGNIYGTTIGFPGRTPATVYEMDDSGVQAIYTFSDPPFPYPYAAMTMDAAGSLYGTTIGGASGGGGTIFKLTPSNGGWTYSLLYSFTDGSDGASPYGNVVVDANGNIFGTTASGGGGNCPNGCGVVLELTP